MIEPVFQSVFLERPEIVSAGDFREIIKIARILDALLTGALETDVDFLLDAVAVAGRADHRATAAIEALVAPFLPYRGLEFYVKNAWKTCEFDFGLEIIPQVFPSLMVLHTVSVDRVADLEVLEKVERFRGTYGQVVFIADVRTEQVESAVRGIVAE